MSTIPSAPAPVSPAASLAHKALDEIARARNPDAGRNLGDTFLQSIADERQSADLERLLARTTQSAARAPLYSGTSAVSAQRVALAVIASGVSGPAGPAIAAVARQAIDAAYNNEDRKLLARPYLDAIAATGRPLEQELASVAIKAASQQVYSTTTVTNAHAAAFRAVEAGVASSREAAIANFGRGSMASAYNVDDRWTVGKPILAHLAANACPESRIVAAAALEASDSRLHSRTSAVAAQDKALELIGAAPTAPPERTLAQLGQHVLCTAYNDSDRAILGRLLLHAIASRTQGPESAVAAAVSAPTAAALYSDQSRVNLLTAAFHALNSLAAEPLDHTLARLGKECHRAGYNAGDQDKMATALLHEIGARSGDRRVRLQVQHAEAALAGGTDARANQKIQQDAFDSIISGRNVVTVALKDVNMSLRLPLVDDETPPEKAKEELAACVPHNREVMSALSRMEQQYSASIPALEAELKKLEEEAAAYSAAVVPIRLRIQRLMELQRVALVPAVGGILGVITSGSPVALGIAAAAAGAWVVLGARLRAAKRQRFALDPGLNHAFKKNITVAELDTARRGLQSVQAVIRQAEPLHRQLDERYRLLEMKQFVEGTVADPDARVELEENFVTIGGLRVPRNSMPA